MQNFGGQIRCTMRNVEVAYYCLLVICPQTTCLDKPRYKQSVYICNILISIKIIAAE